MKSCVIALDQGTTNSRCLVFDETGRCVASAHQEFKQHYPRPGWVEHRPADLWDSQRQAMLQAVSCARDQGYTPAAVGVTNQRETTLLWDRDTGRPVGPAIVWQDRRTADICRRLKNKGLEKRFVEKTGLRLDPYFSGTKLMWMLDHIEGAREAANRGRLAFGTVDAWLIWNLTGGKVHVTDVSNASRTLLFDIRTRAWDAELLELLSIPPSVLPKVGPSSGRIGLVEDDLLPGGVPIAGVAGDQQAALFGQACFEPGMAKNTYGTGAFLLMNTGSRPVWSRNRLLTTVAWQIGDEVEYALEGSVFVAGAAVQWLRDELGLIETAGECDTLAAQVDDTGGVYFVPAFTGLGAPHWDPYARGTLVGLTRGTRRDHICRAALEAMAFQSAEVLECMEQDTGTRLREVRVDGGAAGSRPLLQFQADLLGVPVLRPAMLETTALGAAYLAGLSAGVWAGRDEIAAQWKEDIRFEPASSPDAMKAARRGWIRAVERARGWDEG